MDMSVRDHADFRTADHEEAAGSRTERGNVTQLPTQAAIAAPSGAGWYHDAAIEAARRDAVEARCNPYGH